jgi:hypothetical protein
MGANNHGGVRPLKNLKPSVGPDPNEASGFGGFRIGETENGSESHKRIR